MSRKLTAAAVLAALATGGVGLTGAGAQEATIELRVVHDYSFTKGTGQAPVTVCIDGDVVASGITSGQEAGPVDVAGTSPEVAFIDGVTDDCDADAIYRETVALPPVPAVTLVAINGLADFFDLAVVAHDDEDCTPAAQGTLTVIHGASSFVIGNDDSAVDLTVVDGPTTEGLRNGAAASIDLAPGVHQLEVRPAGEAEVLVDVAVDVVAGQVTEVYLNGGDAGPPPATFQLTRDATVCEEPVTTTTTAPSSTTSTTAPSGTRPTPATPVSATPAYTG
jgi:hypothetical protein